MHKSKQHPYKAYHGIFSIAFLLWKKDSCGAVPQWRQISFFWLVMVLPRESHSSEIRSWNKVVYENAETGTEAQLHPPPRWLHVEFKITVRSSILNLCLKDLYERYSQCKSCSRFAIFHFWLNLVPTSFLRKALRTRLFSANKRNQNSLVTVNIVFPPSGVLRSRETEFLMIRKMADAPLFEKWFYDESN